MLMTTSPSLFVVVVAVVVLIALLHKNKYSICVSTVFIPIFLVFLFLCQSGLALSETDKAKIVKAGSRRCNYECTKQGASSTFVVPSRNFVK
jgi:K+ transporter